MASKTDQPYRKKNERRIYIQTNFRTLFRETFWKHYSKLFMDKDEQEWVGSFEQSWVEQGTFIINLTSKGKSFVVAGGQTFLIDINSREQINTTEISDTKTAILDEKEENIYYSNGFDLCYMDIKGNNFLLFDNNYFDDIKLIEIRNNKLIAVYWNYQTSNEPFRFEIDVVTKKVKDSFYNI